MKRTDKILIALFIIILATALYYSVPHKNTENNRPKVHTISNNNWFPPQLMTTPPQAPTTIYHTTTPQTYYIEVPYSAPEIIFTVYDLENGKTISGTAYYNYAAVITSFTAAGASDGEKIFIKIMDVIGKTQTLTIDQSGRATNKSIEMYWTVITLRTTNTLAIVTLVDPAYTEIALTDTTFSIDLGWLAPNTLNQKTQNYIPLPIIAGAPITTIYSDGTLTIYSPTNMEGEIVTLYNGTTYMDTQIFPARAIVNGTYLTLSGTLAYNSTTTITLTGITQQPPYANLPAETCTATGPIVICSNTTELVAVNSTALYFSYTTEVNSITFTVTGWFAWLTGAQAYTITTIQTTATNAS